jgi:hypothetical protein
MPESFSPATPPHLCTPPTYPTSTWGRAFGPAAGLPSGAGKKKILGQRREPCLYRVPFDVAPNPLDSCIIADQVVVAFVLPERCSVQAKHPDGSVPGKAFKRSEPLSRRYTRSHEQMNMIWHDYERVKFVAFETVFADGEGLDHHCGYFRLAEEDRTVRGMVQQSIHSCEGLSGGQPVVRKGTIDWQTSVQTERHEHSFANDIPMRETAIVPAHVDFSSGRAEAPPQWSIGRGLEGLEGTGGGEWLGWRASP